MNEETIDWILSDDSVDSVSGVPTAAVVFMLYYSLELNHFLLRLSDHLMAEFKPEIRDFGESSVYLAGSAAQGFYLNTDDISEARDLDIVSIMKKDVRKECEFDKKQSPTHGLDNPYHDDDNRQCKKTQKVNETEESSPFYLNVETWDDTYPGFVMLRKCRRNELPVQTSLSHRYVSSEETAQSRTQYWKEMLSFLDDDFRNVLDKDWAKNLIIFSDTKAQGPAATATFTNRYLTVELETDQVYALPYPGWPDIARGWIDRQPVSGWPSQQLKRDIEETGCLIVPKGQKGSRVEDYEWKISFSLAELKLARSITRIQRELVHVLKALFSDVPDEFGYANIAAKFDSYFLLNLMYTESEKIDATKWTQQNIAYLMFQLMDRLALNIRNKHLPHYFIPERNLLHKLTFDSVKLGKGEFSRGIEGEAIMMNVDEYVDFALYTVLRLRYDPLGQMLLQSKYTRLVGHIRQAVFGPLVAQGKGFSKIEASMYITTLLKLAKSHLYKKHFQEANVYIEDAFRFYRRTDKAKIPDKEKNELQITRAICTYLTANYISAEQQFQEIERNFQEGTQTLLEENMEIFLLLHARALTAIAKRQGKAHDDPFLSKAKTLFKRAFALSSANPLVGMELVNFFIMVGLYPEAEELLGEIKGSLVMEDDEYYLKFLPVEPFEEYSEAYTTPVVEEPIYVSDVDESQDTFHLQDSQPSHECDKDSLYGEVKNSGSLEPVDDRDILDLKSIDLSCASEISLEQEMEVVSQIKDTRPYTHQNDEEMVSNAGSLEDEKEQYKTPYVFQNNIWETDEVLQNEKNSRPLLDLDANLDLINQYALIQGFVRIGLNDDARRVQQRLTKTVQERHNQDETVTMQALDHDFTLYLKYKEEEDYLVSDDWENPFYIFKGHVLLCKADEYGLDDVLKALVYRCGVVHLYANDMYFHLRAQILKYDRRLSEALEMVSFIEDHNLRQIHYEILGENEKADMARGMAASAGEGKLSVEERIKRWIKTMIEAARKFEPRNTYLDSVFS